MQIANRKPTEIFDFFIDNGYILTVFENKRFDQMNTDRFMKEYVNHPVELFCIPKRKYIPESL